MIPKGMFNAEANNLSKQNDKVAQTRTYSKINDLDLKRAQYLHIHTCVFSLYAMKHVYTV